MGVAVGAAVGAAVDAAVDAAAAVASVVAVMAEDMEVVVVLLLHRMVWVAAIVADKQESEQDSHVRPKEHKPNMSTR